ncbi:MAG: hypothetical protein CMJ31_13955 [Phycisphaerae bacterium]|nr:hypothetical protein [Phycisphaerae bacterium]
MKTAIKVIALLLGLLILAVVGLTVFAFNSIDSIVEAAIERGGEQALGVPTDCEGADVELFEGKFSMDGLTVSNPSGFESPHFLALPATSVQVDLNSIREDVIVVPTVAIGKADIFLDGSGEKPNYQVILDHVSRNESDDAPAEESDEAGPKFVINSLVLEGANVKVVGFGVASQVAGDVTVDVPRVELQDVGSDEPLTTTELISLVVKTLLSTTIESAGGALPEQLISDLRGRLASLTGLDELGITAIGDVGAIASGLGERAREAVDETRGQIEDRVNDAKNEVEKTVDDAANKLRGILGGGGKNDDDDQTTDDQTEEDTTDDESP